MAQDRKQQILEALVSMLENPKQEKITTAALAARLQVSEAALYRHFAGKAQMFEGLIDFIEQTIFGIINKITTEETDSRQQISRIVNVLLMFAEKNRGMTRVLIGDALVNEDQQLQQRINQIFNRIEATLKQCIKLGAVHGGNAHDPEAHANLLLSFVIGRWHLFAKSGFKRKPTELASLQINTLL